MFDKYSKNDLDLLKRIYPDSYEEQLNKLDDNYPIQYLIGYVDFYGYKIKVNENVLIPRFETEYLVDETIKLVYKYIGNPKVIDIGTGSGCIAISMSKELNVKVTAIDISQKAIDVARDNAIDNNADVEFYCEDIKKFKTKEKYNVLISNPPYVVDSSYVDKETRYEPQKAIYANDNGLEYYKVILSKAKEFLDDKCIIAFEIGDNQANDIISLSKEYYPKAIIIAKNDINELNRYIFIINE